MRNTGSGKFRPCHKPLSTTPVCDNISISCQFSPGCQIPPLGGPCCPSLNSVPSTRTRHRPGPPQRGRCARVCTCRVLKRTPLRGKYPAFRDGVCTCCAPISRHTPRMPGKFLCLIFRILFLPESGTAHGIEYQCNHQGFGVGV